MAVSGDLEITLPLRRRGAVRPVSVPVVAGFEVVRYLGGGGMGVVFEARHVDGHRVALKFRRRGAMRPGAARARLLREAQAMGRIRHRNVVSLFDVGIADDEVFIAMDLVDGGTLRDWMEQSHDWREVVAIFIAFGRGLARVHALGVVHRDVNPSNVFLDRAGTPKLGDFGLAATAHELVEDLGLVLGTPGYLAPEQLGDGRANAQSDQYAFCVSLHEALTGRRPESPAGELLVPRPLRAILARGLATDPSARFPSMNVLLSALEAATTITCGR